MEYNRQEFFVILDHFLPFYTPNNLKNQKTHEDIIILHMCTINDNHMIYCSGDMERDRQNFLRKKKHLKKKHLEISSFYTSVPKIMIICYNVPGCMTDLILLFFILGYFKKAWRYHHFTHVYQKL